MAQEVCVTRLTIFTMRRRAGLALGIQGQGCEFNGLSVQSQAGAKKGTEVP